MEIKSISYPVFGAKQNNIKDRKLIPASEYKGPILELTDSDKKAIEELQKQKTYYEVEHYKLTSYITSQKIPQHKKNYYYGILFDLELSIEGIEAKIREIKKARYQQQLQDSGI